MTTVKSQSEKSIEMLVDEAHHFTQINHQSRGPNRSWASARLTFVAVAVAAALWLFHLTHGPSREEIFADLEQMVLQASASVEGAMKTRATLPDRLDDPHLAAVVQYLPQWSDPMSGRHQYTLIARAGRYSVVWNNSEPQRFERQE